MKLAQPQKGEEKLRIPFLLLYIVGGSAILIGAFYAFEVSAPSFFHSEYFLQETQATTVATQTPATPKEPPPPVWTPIYLKTPEPLHAIYMTQCVAGTPSFRDKLVALAEETGVNAIIIDIKDFSGGLGFVPADPELKKYLSTRCYAADLRSLVKRINEAGIYAIARITVFQDPLYAPDHPDIAVQKESDKSTWHDFKGLSYVDPGAKSMWDYIVKISREARAIGFDELNFDYVRFPSDGDMKDIYYPVSEARVVADPDYGKAKVLREFFAYLDEKLEDTGVVISADLFGMTTTNRDDLNIGQVLEYTLPYFDYVSPMVYPSHYPRTFMGFENPAAHPYDVVRFSMDSAVARVGELAWSASTTPDSREAKVHTLQLRPWLQDFDLGATYDLAKVQAEMQATYDAGLTSWMLWDAANTYTRAALGTASSTEAATVTTVDETSTTTGVIEQNQ